MSIVLEHGRSVLPAVTVDAYNAELRDGDGFVGDNASKGAFRSSLAEVRQALAETGDDPLGEASSEEIPAAEMDRLLAEGSPTEAAVLLATIEAFAGDFVAVIRRFLKLAAWRGTQVIVVGGGLRGSRVGELAIGRAEVMLRATGVAIELRPIRHDPDEAGLLGGAHLCPSWMFHGHDAILALDIGGTNIRAGLVELNLRRAPDLSKSAVAETELWRHRDEEPGREETVQRIVAMLERLIKRARKGEMKLAPVIAVGCPGLIAADGRIERGGQNLPGNWEDKGFNLPDRLREAIPRIGEFETHVVMHNDAVVQGLSQVPFVTDVERWGVMTIGTGLGNARFTNRRKE